MSEGPDDGRQPCILMIEDDEAYSYAASLVLMEAGFRVLQAQDFRTALPILEGDEDIDLLLTDVVMAGVNGVALSRMARLARPQLKILYLTGHDSPALAREALGEVLHKPITNDRLIDAVRRSLDLAPVPIAS
jgi:DNA-binding NtrC family response regulator